MKVWHCGRFVEIDENTELFVGRCSSGRTVFGERAHFVKATKVNLVFETESGAIVKTELDTLNTVGKAKKAHYWVGLGDRSNDKDVYHERVSYWNEKKCCFETK